MGIFGYQSKYEQEEEIQYLRSELELWRTEALELKEKLVKAYAKISDLTDELELLRSKWDSVKPVEKTTDK